MRDGLSAWRVFVFWAAALAFPASVLPQGIVEPLPPLSSLPDWRRGLDRPRLVDRVVAMIDYEPVLLSEVEEALSRYQGKEKISEGPPTEQRLRRALDRWIDETLILKAAKKVGLTVSAERVDSRVDDLLASLEETEEEREQLKNALARAGKSREKFRDRLRKWERRGMIVGMAVAARVSISDADVTAFEAKRRAKGEPTELYHLSKLFLPMSQRASKAKWDRAVAACYELRVEALEKKDFTSTAARWVKTCGYPGAEGGTAGVLLLSEMEAKLAEAAKGLEVGSSSEPIRTSRGLHVLYLIRKDTARDILFAERYEKEREKWLVNLRSAATIDIDKKKPLLIGGN